jgi:hypothetical protein
VELFAGEGVGDGEIVVHGSQFTAIKWGRV